MHNKVHLSTILECPWRDSNSHLRLRRPVRYPLRYRDNCRLFYHGIGRLIDVDNTYCSNSLHSDGKEKPVD